VGKSAVTDRPAITHTVSLWERRENPSLGVVEMTSSTTTPGKHDKPGTDLSGAVFPTFPVNNFFHPPSAIWVCLG